MEGEKIKIIEHAFPKTYEYLCKQSSKSNIYFTCNIGPDTLYIHDENSYNSFKSFALNPAFKEIELIIKSGTISTQNIATYYDIIIVGSGLAGLVAAYKCAKFNIKSTICIIEKESSVGGNSIKATSGINCCYTPIQESLKVKDSCELFYQDTVKSGRGYSSPELVKMLVDKSFDAFLFFQSMGLNMNQVSICGGHSAARTHKPKEGPVGYNLVMAVYNKIKLLFPSRVVFITDTRVTALNYNSTFKYVSGVNVTQKEKAITINSRAVIMCTGGFSSDKTDTSLLKKYAPSIIDYPTTNGRYSEGDGIKIAEKLKPQLVDMSRVQIHPTGFIDPTNPNCQTKFLAPELLRAVGGILINQKGERFCNELGYRDDVTAAIVQHCKDKIAYIILCEDGAESFGPNFMFYVGKQFIKKYQNLHEICNSLLINYETLVKTITIYNKKSCIYGKSVFPNDIPLSQPLYVGLVTPCIHYTMGGLKFNTRAEIIDENNDAISGLYGAGEVTGGLHGANRLAGNSLLECYVFGTIAGEEAAKKLESAKL